MGNEIRITVIDGYSAGDVLSAELTGEVTIGRSGNCGIKFDDRDVELSGHHFKIVRESDGVIMTNFGKNHTYVNGHELEKGGIRRLSVGDEVRIGKRIRFRFDAIGDAPMLPTAGEAMSMTSPTRPEPAATMATGATMATKVFAPSRHSTVIASQPTVAVDAERTSTDFNADTDTRVADFDTDSNTNSFDGDPTSTSSPVSERPTDRNSELTTEQDDARTKLLNRPTESDEDTSFIGGTSFIDPKKYLRMMEIERRKHLYRRILIGVSALIFLSVMGCVVWLRWPHAERYLTIPLKPGTEQRDYAHIKLKDESGRDALVAYYVRDRSMREQRTGDGNLEVTSVLGRDRDVNFWLRVTRMTDEQELQLSLEQSVDRLLKVRTAKDHLKLLSTSEWPGDGYCFMEEEYPGASHGLMHGTRMFRSEYQVMRNRVQRHGVLFVLRNRTTVWLIEHDIPESEWERGKFQMMVNPNFEFYADYLRDRWESPGTSSLLLDRDVSALFREVEYDLELSTPRKGEWTQLKRKLDTLVYRTVLADNADSRRAIKLLRRFRAMQDREYNGYVLAFALQNSRGTKGKNGRAEVSESCRKVFGVDDAEYFSALIGDLEVWQCQKRNH